MSDKPFTYNSAWEDGYEYCKKEFLARVESVEQQLKKATEKAEGIDKHVAAIIEAGRELRASLSNWMEIAEDHDKREYDQEAINHWDKALEEAGVLS